VASTAAAPPAEAAFPGGNGRIVFASNEGGFERSLVTIEPDGSGRTRIVDRGDEPAWSPDGTRIAYTAPATLSHGPQLAIVNADGSGTVFPTGTSDNESQPSWSPDGSRIAFTRYVPDGSFFVFEVYVMNADGTGQRRVTDSRADDLGFAATEPAWSPDGTRIAFTRTIRLTGNQPLDEEIYVMNADGTGLTRLTHNPATGILSNDLSPAWSPDGSRIVFSSRRDGRYGVHVMNADGTGLRRVAEAPQASFPAWSPAGDRLAFANPFQDIHTVGLDGTGLTNVTATPSVSELNPDWQPVNRGPDCSGVRAAPDSLWPPNKHLRAVSLSGATDPDGDAVTIAVTGVTHDEGDAAADWSPGDTAAEVLLRADRDPKGDGRVYAIAFEVTDEDGAACTSAATVTVPRHRP
jgi:Tol biopolymer transport system component